MDARADDGAVEGAAAVVRVPRPAPPRLPEAGARAAPGKRRLRRLVRLAVTAAVALAALAAVLLGAGWVLSQSVADAPSRVARDLSPVRRAPVARGRGAGPHRGGPRRDRGLEVHL